MEQKGSISSDNHFLSQLYLKAWANNKKVFVYNRLVPNNNYYLWQHKSIKSLGKYKNMFVRFKHGEESDDIEKWFNERYETPSTIPLNKAIAGNKISSDEWKQIIDFIMCHWVRSPKFIINVLELANDGGKVIFEEECKKTINLIEKQQYINKEEDKDFIELFPIKITDKGFINKNTKEIIIETIFHKQFYLWIMKYILENDAKMLYNHKWGIITVDERVNIPTSDNPIAAFKFLSLKDYIFDVPLGETGTIILFPISPKKIIYTQIGNKNIQTNWKVDYITSKWLKKIIVENSYRTVISNIEDESVPLIIPRIVNEKIFLEEKEFWEDFHKRYIEREKDYIK